MDARLVRHTRAPERELDVPPVRAKHTIEIIRRERRGGAAIHGDNLIARAHTRLRRWAAIGHELSDGGREVCRAHDREPAHIVLVGTGELRARFDDHALARVVEDQRRAC